MCSLAGEIRRPGLNYSGLGEPTRDELDISVGSPWSSGQVNLYPLPKMFNFDSLDCCGVVWLFCFALSFGERAILLPSTRLWISLGGLGS